MSYKVTLNVYDLAPVNQYLYGVGLGFYHTGVEINGREWSFGGSPEMMGTGVFDSEPLAVDQDAYRGSVEMGKVSSVSEFYKIIDQIKDEFPAKDYNVLTRNCNHFSSALCRRILDRDIPAYINRMANMS